MKSKDSKNLGRTELNELFRVGLGELSFGNLAEISKSASTLKDLASVFFPFAALDSIPKFWGDKSKTLALDEEELPDVHSRYRVLVEQIPAIVFMSFLDRGISEAYISPQIETMLGFTQAEWLNDPVRWFEQLHEEDKTRWSVEAAQMFLTGEPLRSTYRVKARDNRVIWFHCEAKMVRRKDGRPWFIHGVAFDVTELKHKEFERQNALNQLSESEKMLRSIFEFAPDSMVVVNAFGRIERVNSQVEKMFGYKPDELINQELNILMPERFRNIHTQHQRGFMKSPHIREMGSNLELFALRKDGTEFPADIILSPVETENGTIVIAVVRDITRRKTDEQALLSYAEQQNILSRRLLEVQEAERRRIALELHDEFGQTLTGLKLTLEMAARNSSESSLDSINYAQNLVNELMAKARKLSLDLRPAALDHLGLLSAYLWLIRNYTERTNIIIDFKHSGISGRRFLSEIETSVYRVGQEALTNIARHADVKTAKILLWADENSVNLTVEDDGKGFDVEEVLQKGDSTGIAGMRERVLFLGGNFSIESTQIGGTKINASWNL
ncbi:MAG TPA: PAS domain S-box protein [Pyrinomonadaceae bacterium]|nr:PAS domain S-box protein [Pyrinomonadaceae bacterium]